MRYGVSAIMVIAIAFLFIAHVAAPLCGEESNSPRVLPGTTPVIGATVSVEKLLVAVEKQFAVERIREGRKKLPPASRTNSQALVDPDPLCALDIAPGYYGDDVTAVRLRIQSPGDDGGCKAFITVFAGGEFWHFWGDIEYSEISP